MRRRNQSGAAAQRIPPLMRLSCSYPAGEPVAIEPGEADRCSQAQPRDIGALALVVALFVVLFVAQRDAGVAASLTPARIASIPNA